MFISSFSIFRWRTDECIFSEFDLLAKDCGLDLVGK